MFTRILRLSAVLCLYAVWHVATAQAQFCVPPPSGIVSWWPANGDATDFFGANNGALEGGAIATAPGEVNTAFQFDGTNGFVQVPNSAALEPTNLTVEAWVRFDSLNSAENSTPGHEYIVFKQNSRSGGFEGYDLGKHRVNSQDLLYFQVASSSGTEIKVDSTNAVTTGVWYHVAGVRGSNYIQLYVNGQLQGQAAVSFPQDYGHLPLCFGSTGQSYWDGKLAGELDEVSLYNRPLSSNEIFGIYRAGSAGKCQESPSCTPPPPGLVSWWKGEENANDSYNTNNGTLVGGAAFGTGEVGQAFNLNGTSQYVMVPNSPGLDVSNQFTIDCWINHAPTDASTPPYEGIVIADYYGIEWATGTSGFYAYMSANSGSSYFVTTSANPSNMTFPAGQWHHLAATYDGTNLQMYLDGQAWGKSEPASGNVSPMGAGDFLTLGSENGRYCGCGGRYFNGSLDEVDLFNRALSASEIQAIYAAGSAGKCGEPPVITSNPQNKTVLVGSSASFTVSAVGFQPLACQWQFNGTNISPSVNPTATNLTLVLTNAQPAQSGNISALVSNLYGSTESSNAALTVYQSVTRYVAAGNAGAAAPYTNWSTAASNIQDAIDAATNTDLILVTNGVYQAGGRVIPPFSLTNRIVINKAVTVQSVNGPSVTTIQGYQVPGTVEGDSAVRCAYLTNGASLIGFTLNNGTTRAGGDSSHEQNGGGVWAESTNAIVSNCLFAGCAAYNSGGGVFNATLENCTLAGARAVSSGGAASGSVLNGCLLTNNSVLGLTSQETSGMGGAAINSVLNNCTIAGNYAPLFGGGTAFCTLNGCVVEGNTGDDGGGADSCTLNGCAVIGNFAKYGGGAYSSTLNNCTLTGNNSIWSGGVYGSTVNNSIVYYNIASTNANFDATDKLNFCCTTPAVASGAGNITNEPQLATVFHLSQNSPCRGAGSPSYATGTDINGNAWQNPPSIGCEEYMAAGSLSVSIQPGYAMVPPGFTLGLVAQITGRPASSVWNFGDGTMLTNEPYASHSWNTPGDYVVVLTAYNNDNPGGISASMAVHIATSAVLYVDQHGTNPVPPFSSWSTAATNIQDAVDACSVPGAMIWVTNGLYSTGGHASPPYGLVNRVMITQPITLQSVNGPAVTVIEGSQVAGSGYGSGAIRCVYLANGAALAGFTLTNGATLAEFQAFIPSDLTNEQTGAGIFCATSNTMISNCVLVSNVAYGMGGGAYQGTFVNCSFVGNSSAYGGGAVECVLTNCLIASNVAVYQYGELLPSQLLSCGGGAAQCTLQNCTLVSNSVSLLQGSFAKGGGAYRSILTSCLIMSNSGLNGAGAGWLCQLTNCMLIANYSPSGVAGSSESTLNNCTLAYNSGLASDGDTLNYCTIISNSGFGAYQGTLNYCSVVSNTGGGVAQSTLNYCNLIGNVTTSEGGGALTSTLNNCLLIGNTAGDSGGGAYGGVLSNCTVIGNIAGNEGGGVYVVTRLDGCTISGNSAGSDYGAGVLSGTARNCLIVSNTAANYIGGIAGGTLDNCTIAYNYCTSNYLNYPGTTLNNCILYSNIASSYANSTLNFSCTTPLPPGLGNITNNPLFVNPAAGDFHLQSNSPCINSGNNAYVSTPTDLDGNPRISGGTVDIGAYEFQNPASIISYAWLQQYGLATDGSADFADPDHDGMNNYSEWLTGTDPTNQSSVLQLLKPTTTNSPSGVVVTWQSVPNINYYLLRATNLSVAPAFQTIATNLPGQAGTTSYTDTNTPAPGPYYYRVGVQH